jgi:hypothetical protein
MLFLESRPSRKCPDSRLLGQLDSQIGLSPEYLLLNIKRVAVPQDDAGVGC